MHICYKMFLVNLRYSSPTPLHLCILIWTCHRLQLPKGTHEWSKFLTPEELVLILQRTSVTVSWLISDFSSAVSFSILLECIFPPTPCVWYAITFCSFQVQEMAGFVYNPLSGKWLLSDDISVNYIAFGTKKSDE